MFRKSSTGSTRRVRSVHVVAAGVLLLAMSGSATAAMVITGKQIKDNSITGRDIKNGTLKVNDLKASEAAKLRGNTGATGGTGAAGATGATGATGAAGASAFAPPPSGTVIRGGGVLNAHVSAPAVFMRNFAPLPFTTPTRLDDSGVGQNLFFGSQNSGILSPGDVNAALCPGTHTAPNPTAGYMCVYIAFGQNIAAMSGALAAGSALGPDAAENSGFYVAASGTDPGALDLRYVWAYKAP